MLINKKRASEITIVLIFFCLILFLNHKPAQAAAINKLKSTVSAKLDSKINSKGYGAVVFGFVYGGNIVYTKSYGDGVNRTLSGTYKWASVSKTLTALIIMRMVEQGKIASIDHNIWQYTNVVDGKSFSSTSMPTYCDDGQSCATSPLTLKWTLFHNGGFYHLTGSVWEGDKLHLKYKPGTSHYYSSEGFNVLGDVIASRANKKYYLAVIDYIATPGGLSCAKASNMCVRPDNPTSWWTPAAYIHTNIEDFANYAAGIINNKFVSAATLDLMPQNHYGGYYGLGFQIEGSGDNITAYHSGHDGSDEAYFYIKPKLERGIVWLGYPETLSVSQLHTLADELDELFVSEENPCLNPTDCISGTPSTPFPSPSIRPSSSPSPRPSPSGNTLEIILDNDDGSPDYVESTIDSWFTSGASGAHGGTNGTTSRANYCSISGGNASWQKVIPQTGNWEVSAWWTASVGRIKTAQYQIYRNNNLIDTIVVNQQANGNQFNTLGIYPFTANDTTKVTLLDTPSSGGTCNQSGSNNQNTVSADAIKLSLQFNALSIPQLLSNWLSPNGDLNNDGKVNSYDFTKFIQ